MKRLPVLYIAATFVMLFSACDGKEGRQNETAEKAMADSLAQVSYDAYDAFDFQSAVDNGQQALQMYEEMGDTTSMCDIMSTLMLAHLRLGNVAEGFRLAERTISLDSIKGDPEMLSIDYNSMAGMYLAEDKGNEAEPFILKAIECELQTPEKANLSNRYGIASEVYCKMERPEEAVDYAEKGLDIARERQDTVQIGKRLSQLAQAYIAARDFEKAESTMKECVIILDKTHSDVSLAITYRQLANIYENRHQTSLAIEYYEKAMELARKTNYSMLLCQCTQAVGELSASARPDYAIMLLKESRALADTLHSHKIEEMMADYATRYDLNEKRITIEKQAAQLKMHRMLLLVIGLVLTVVAIVLLFSIYMKRLHRRHEQLEARFSEKVVEQTQHKEPELSNADREFVEKLAAYVEEHLSDSNLSSTAMAEEFCLSPRQFSRRVKQLTGIDCTHYIRASRILKARKLLSETDLPVQDVYVECGFESASYFARVFRTDTGVSPTEYRRKNTL